MPQGLKVALTHPHSFFPSPLSSSAVLDHPIKLLPLLPTRAQTKGSVSAECSAPPAGSQLSKPSKDFTPTVNEFCNAFSHLIHAKDQLVSLLDPDTPDFKEALLELMNLFVSLLFAFTTS